MLRRQARLRREYLYRKAVEDKQKTIQDKKDKIKNSLETGAPIDTNLKNQALNLVDNLQWEDEGPKLAAAIGAEEGGTCSTNVDDEYRWAGVEDPKVMITTSRDPSSRLKMFAKEVRLIIPNAQKMNRGNYEMKELIHACRANNVTDFIVLHEHRGVPDNMVVCHLPYGPTAYFNISDVTMRHDIPNIGTVPEQYPHVIMHNFKTKLGIRVMNIIKHLFPVPKADTRRTVTFANHDDHIAFRHHTFIRVI